MLPVRARRYVRSAARRYREARMLARALRHKYRPVVAHLIPTRRCNLSCTYCNEYDSHSLPVQTADVIRRIDRLCDLGTGIITLSGGEPLLHPDLEAIIRHIRRRGSIATLITNGTLLTRERIKALNRAGLDHLQISIDNVLPDDISKKSLKVLNQKLQWLAELREFDVTVNSVVGSGITNPTDALTISGRARELGFSTTVGLIHDRSGQLLRLDEWQQQVLEQIVTAGKSTFDYANYNRFQRNLAQGKPNDWECHAGARYLYVCEDGRVHWCSQQRGRPGLPLEHYGDENLRTEYHARKTCAPFCTVGCVHRVAQVDDLRRDPQQTLSVWFGAPGREQPRHLPLAVRMLMWAFVTGKGRFLFRRAATGMFDAGRRN